MTPYLTTPGEWAALARVIRRAGSCGWDSETYGHNVKDSSPAFRAEVDVWSLAVATGRLSPRGYILTRGVVLPAVALDDAALRGVLEDPGVEKIAHNARHDLHAAANRGVRVRGARDTLETARLLWPQLETFTLKSLRVTVLGKDGRDTFADLTAPVEVAVPRVVTRCVCGDRGCRRRKAPHGPVQVTETTTRREACPVESIGPGHARWEAKLAYAAADAEDAAELAQVCRARLREMGGRLPALPW